MSMPTTVLEPGLPGSSNLIGLDLAGTLMTAEEFDVAKRWDEKCTYELIRGVRVCVPTPAEAERGPNELLGNLLFVHRRTHPEGLALDATLPEHHVATPENRRRADRVIWSGLGRRPNPRIDSPSIIVEFVSPGKRSRLRVYEEKRREYLGAGVREHWVFDRFQRLLTVFSADGTTAEFGESCIYRTPLLPGFELPLGAILDATDDWSSSPS